jgi:AcrR family transcriptional regulator
MTSNKARKPSSKANSPVKSTGQASVPKKRLLLAKSEDLEGGREKILMAARACFAKQGFSGTSIKDIQTLAGFSRGTIYHYFKTKEEIVQIIISQNLGRFCARVEAILQASNDQNPSLLEIIKGLAALAEEITKGPGRGMAFHVWSLAMVEPDVRKMMVSCFEKIRGALEQKIIVLQQKGEIPPSNNVQDLSVALFGLVIPAFTLQSVYFDKKALDADAYGEALKLLLKKQAV